MVKNPSANPGDAGDVGSIPGSGRFPGGGYGNPLNYSCLENPKDREAQWATVQRITELHTTEVTQHNTHFIAITFIVQYSYKVTKIIGLNLSIH